MTDYALTYLSLGAGVQSSALLVCSALGLHSVPRADVAIFADTGDEPHWVYTHLGHLQAWSPIPIVTTSYGRLSDDLRAGSRDGGRRRGVSAIPAFTLAPDGSKGHLQRHCTWDYKMMPIQREVLARLNGGRALGLLGISVDEAIRMKPSRHPRIDNAFPLVDAGISRRDCERIIAEAGLPTPKRSACSFCPFHSDAYWADLKRDAAEWEKVVSLDRFIRSGLPGVNDPAFLHASRKPLDEVEFDPHGAAGQGDLFGNECEGMCGL